MGPETIIRFSIGGIVLGMTAFVGLKKGFIPAHARPGLIAFAIIGCFFLIGGVLSLFE